MSSSSLSGLFTPLPKAMPPILCNNITSESFQLITGAGTDKILTSDASGNGTWEDLSGILSIAPIGSSPNANGMTLTGDILNLQPASASFGGALTSGIQSISGDKTFLGNLKSGAGLIGGITTYLSNSVISANAFIIYQPSGAVTTLTLQSATTLAGQIYIYITNHSLTFNLQSGTDLIYNGDSGASTYTTRSAPEAGIIVSDGNGHWYVIMNNQKLNP